MKKASAFWGSVGACPIERYRVTKLEVAVEDNSDGDEAGRRRTGAALGHLATAASIS